MKTKLLLSALLSFSFCLLSSQVPLGFNYQAIARDGSGNILANQALPVRISIMADSAGTSVYWLEQHLSVTTNNFGLINLVVGKGSRISGTAATFDAINWSVTPIFIKTEINYGSWITMGISRLWSVPYALTTKSSNPWQLNGSSLYYSGGNVGIETNIPPAPLTVTYNDNTGITYPLYIQNASGDWSAAEKGVGLKFGRLDPTSGHDYGTIRGTIASGSGGDGRLQFIGGGGTDPHMTIDHLGNVGIGTINPLAKLQINGDIYIPYNSGNPVLKISTGHGSTFSLIPGLDELVLKSDHTGNPTIMWMDKYGQMGIPRLFAGDYASGAGSINTPNMEIGGPSPTNINGQATIYFHHHQAVAHQLRYTGGYLFLEAAGNGYGTTQTPGFIVGGPLYAAVNGGNVGFGITTSPSKVAIQPESGWSDDVPLFEVKNKYGVAVLAVYNTGVRIQVEHDDAKGVKGGFSVGGYDMTKAGTTSDFMIISPDSIKFNISNTSAKGVKGGFSVGGYDATKGYINQNFLSLTPTTSNRGAYNTFIGYEAGKNSKGPHNTFVGVGAGKGTASFSTASNIFIGEGAGMNNTGGFTTQTIGIPGGGTVTVYNSGGGENVAIGNYTGVRLTGVFSFPNWSGGQRNVLLGHYSGSYLTTGSNNVIIGQSAGTNLVTGSGNIFIGNKAGFNETGSNKLYIANSSTSTPLIFGDFDLNYIAVNGQMSIGTTSPAYSLDVNGEVAARSSNAFRLRGPTYSTILRQDGTDAFILLTNSGDPDGSFNGLRPFHIHCADGSVTIGNGLSLPGLAGTSSGYTMRIYNNTVYYLSSSIKTKTNIEPLKDDFYKILQAEPVSFTDKTSGERNIGYIAEDFESKGLNKLVIYKNGEPMSLSYELVSLYILEVVKKQQQTISSQQMTIETQKSEIDLLKARLDKIEAAISE